MATSNLAFGLFGQGKFYTFLTGKSRERPKIREFGNLNSVATTNLTIIIC